MLEESDFLRGECEFLRLALGGYANWFGFNGQEPVTRLVQATTAPGSALLLTDKGTLAACFPDAFLLPVRWERRECHSECLPAGVVAQADIVLNAFGDTARNWKLAALDESLAGVDLSQLPISGNSGCASLAAALATALRGTRVNVGVFASAGWERDALSPVTGLKVKIDLLGKFGISVRVFVHKANETEARKCAAPSVDVVVFERPVSPSRDDALMRMQVRNLTDALGQLPSFQEHGLDACITAFNQPDWVSGQRRFQYYRDEIAPELSRILRERAGIESWGRTFVLLYNPGNEPLAVNLLSLVRPERLVMIRQPNRETEKDEAEDRKARLFAASAGFIQGTYELIVVDPRDREPQILDSINEIAATVRRLGGNCLFVDVQSATTFLRAVGYAVARRLGATPMGLEQVWDNRNLLCSADAKIQDLSFVWR